MMALHVDGVVDELLLQQPYDYAATQTQIYAL